MVEHETERLFVDRAHPRRPAISEIDDSERRERAKRLANNGARDAKPSGEIRFARLVLSKNLGRAIQQLAAPRRDLTG